jgi:hypothetical protein
MKSGNVLSAIHTALRFCVSQAKPWQQLAGEHHPGLLAPEPPRSCLAMLLVFRFRIRI